MILGAAVGSIEGIRSRSLNRTIIGIIGGLSGGFAGGSVLEFIGTFWNSGFTARGLGILLMGGSIGLFYTLFESAKSFGMLKILNRSFKRQGICNQYEKDNDRSIKKSSLDLAEHYTGLNDMHACFISGRDEVIIKQEEGEVLVK